MSQCPLKKKLKLNLALKLNPMLTLNLADGDSLENVLLKNSLSHQQSAHISQPTLTSAVELENNFV